MPRYTKEKKDIVRFEDNTPVSLVLDSEPTKVRGKEMQGNYGSYKSYAYFTKDGRIFFATEFLHNQLATFRRGDEITITKDTSSGKVSWVVKRGGEGARATINNVREGIKDSSFEKRLKALEESVFGTSKLPVDSDVSTEEDEEDYEVDDSGLPF